MEPVIGQTWRCSYSPVILGKWFFILRFFLNNRCNLNAALSEMSPKFTLSFSFLPTHYITLISVSVSVKNVNAKSHWTFIHSETCGNWCEYIFCMRAWFICLAPGVVSSFCLCVEKICPFVLLMCLFEHRARKCDPNTGGHLRHVLLPVVTWRTLSCPLVMWSPRTDGNTRSEKGLRAKVRCLNSIRERHLQQS